MRTIMRFSSSFLLCLAVLPRGAAAAGEEPRFVARAEIKEAGELKLDWPWMPYISRDLFLLGVHRSGVVDVFRRDEKTGDLAFLSAVPVATDLGSPGRHLDPHVALSSKDILYVTGAWTHAKNDQHSLGLSWYQLERKDGSYRKLGTIPCSAGVLWPAAKPDVLYLSTYFAKEIQVIRLAADGTPTVGERITGKGVGTGLSAPADRRHWYTMSAQSVAWLTSDAAGTLTYGGAVDIPDAVADKISNLCVVAAPDGRHVYAMVRHSYSKGYGAVFSRDAASGALTFVETIDMSKLIGVNHVVFTADGTVGYFAGTPECAGAGLGWFRRDPQSGKLTFVAKAPGAPASWYLAYDGQLGRIYSGGFWSSKSIRVYDVPAEAP